MFGQTYRPWALIAIGQRRERKRGGVILMGSVAGFSADDSREGIKVIPAMAPADRATFSD